MALQNEASFRKFKRATYEDEIPALLGNGAGVTNIPGQTGKVWIRIQQGEGYSNPIAAWGGGGNYPVYDDAYVTVKYNYRQKAFVVKGGDFQNLVQQGYDPSQLNAGDTRNNWIHQNQITTLICTAVGTTENPSLEVQVQPFIYEYPDKTLNKFVGGKISFSSLIPSSGEHRVGVVFLNLSTAALTVAGSTAKSEVLPLEFADINEVIAAKISGYMKIWAWRLKGGATNLTVTDSFEDLRELWNLPAGYANAGNVVKTPDSATRNDITPTADTYPALRLKPNSGTQSENLLIVEDETTAHTATISKAGVITGTQVNVDNLRVDGNRISSTNTNGDIELYPNGTGDVEISAEQIDVNITATDGTALVTITPSGDNSAALRFGAGASIGFLSATPGGGTDPSITLATAEGLQISLDGLDDKIKVTGDTTFNDTVLVDDVLTVTGDLVVDTDTLFVDESADRVGINNASPTVALDVTGAILASSSVTGASIVADNLTLDGNTLSTTNSNGELRVIPNGTGDIRTQSSAVSVAANNNTGFTMYPSTPALHLARTGNPSLFVGVGNTTGDAVHFYRNTSLIGWINVSSVQCQYQTISDHRLKENITDASFEEAVIKLKAIPVRQFRFKDDEAPQDRVGFIAHELQVMAPEAVSGEKDAVDEHDNPKYQGVDASKLVPTLVLALQDALRRIEILEANQ